MKKIITALLIISVFISCFSLFATSASAEEGYTEDSITVVFNRKDPMVMELKVFVDKEGSVLLPTDILTWFGGLKRVSGERDNVYAYSPSGLEKSTKTERQIRITVTPSYVTGTMRIERPEKAPVLSDVEQFSKYYQNEDALFLPLEELVPFLDARVSIEKGFLYITPNPVSIFDALTYASVEDTAFSSDEMIDRQVIGATSYIIDTVYNLRVDRLVFNIGKKIDYEKLFNKIIDDDEIFLSGYDKEHTPTDKAFISVNKCIIDGEAAGFIKEIHDGVSDLNELYEIFTKDSDSAGWLELSREDVASIGIDAINAVLDYKQSFSHAIRDHRNMISVVYQNADLADTTAGKAAKKVCDLYSEDEFTRMMAIATSTLRDLLIEKGTDLVANKIFPHKAVMIVLKNTMPEIDLSQDYDIFYLDQVTEDSEIAYNHYYENMEFNKRSLEYLRLSLLMTMLTSKYAYDTLSYHKIPDDADLSDPFLSSRMRKRLQINEWLNMLYLSFDSIECSTPEYYQSTKAELKNKIQELDLASEYVSEGLDFYRQDDNTYTVAGIGSCTDVNVVIPAEYNGLPVTDISLLAFDECDTIKSVVIPNSVKSIGAKAFYGCKSLEKVVMPDSVKNIGFCAFENCISLTEVTMPRYLESIEYWTFSGCLALESIELPVALKDIGDRAFERCESLVEIDLPSSLLHIGNHAFGSCLKLESVSIPENVTSLSDSVFFNCLSLKSIDISSTMFDINSMALSYCISLTDINFDGTVSEWNEINKFDFWDWNSGKYTVNCNDGEVVKEGSDFENTPSEGLEFSMKIDGSGYILMGIGDCKDSVIVIPAEHEGLPVTLIRDGAFKGLTSITEVIIPDTVTEIGQTAFADCTSLESVLMSDSVTTMGLSVFNGCTSLKEVVLSNSLTEIPGNAFAFCKSLKKIVIPNSVKILSHGAFSDCTSLKTVIMSNSLTTIGFSVFAHCIGLELINLPDTIETIEFLAFVECTSLKKIVLPASVEIIEKEAFRDCTSLIIYCEGKSQPVGWAYGWNRLYYLGTTTIPVVWGYTDN